MASAPQNFFSKLFYLFDDANANANANANVVCGRDCVCGCVCDCVCDCKVRKGDINQQTRR